MAAPLTEIDKRLLLGALGTPETTDRVIALLNAAGTGDVTGPGSSTDNALPRFDGVAGNLLQNSGVIVDDSNNLSGIAALSAASVSTGALVSTGDLTLSDDLLWSSDGAGDIGANGTNRPSKFYLLNYMQIGPVGNTYFFADSIAGFSRFGYFDSGLGAFYHFSYIDSSRVLTWRRSGGANLLHFDHSDNVNLNLLWAVDGQGSIGADNANRPSVVNAVTGFKAGTGTLIPSLTQPLVVDQPNAAGPTDFFLVNDTLDGFTRINMATAAGGIGLVLQNNGDVAFAEDILKMRQGIVYAPAAMTGGLLHLSPGGNIVMATGFTAADEQMRIVAADGVTIFKNLGVGTAPVNKFDLRQDQDAATLITFRNSDVGGSATVRGRFVTDAGNFDVYATSIAAGAQSILQSDATFTGGMRISQDGMNPISLTTNSIERLAVSGVGVVKIGGTGETEIHEVNGALQAPAAGVLTLTNGPGASTGDPSVYLTLNINGTNYVIPAWAF